MKKLILSIFITIVLLVMSSCTGTQRSADSLYFTSLIGNQEIELELKTPVSNVNLGANKSGSVAFTTKMSAAEFSKELANNNESLKEIDANYMCFLDEDGNEYPLFLKQSSAASGNRFTITDMRMNIVYGLSENSGTISIDVYMPYHLISDERLLYGDNILYAGQNYETISGIERFAEFFDEIGWYSTESIDGKLIVYGYAADDIDGLPEIEPLTISFEESLGIRYFSVTVDEGADT